MDVLFFDCCCPLWEQVERLWGRRVPSNVFAVWSITESGYVVGGELQKNGDGLEGMAERSRGEERGGLWVPTKRPSNIMKVD